MGSGLLFLTLSLKRTWVDDNPRTYLGYGPKQPVLTGKSPVTDIRFRLLCQSFDHLVSTHSGVPNPAVDWLSAIVRYQKKKRTHCKDLVRNNLCAREHFSTDYLSLANMRFTYFPAAVHGSLFLDFFVESINSCNRSIMVSHVLDTKDHNSLSVNIPSLPGPLERCLDSVAIGGSRPRFWP